VGRSIGPEIDRKAPGRLRWRASLYLACLAVLLPIPSAGWVKRNPFGSATPLPDSFRGAVCHIGAWSPVLPNFEHVQPVGFIYTYSLNVPTRSYEEGMPGVTDRIEWFAIDYQGDFWIEHPGKYRFHLTSDDGSRLSIDGKTVIDNDGIHPTTSMGGSAELAGGNHHIRVEYFQGPGSALALVLEVAAPGERSRVFDMRDFRPPSKAPAIVADENRPHARRDAAFRGSAALTGFELVAFEALNARPRPHAFEFRARAFRFPAGDASSQYALVFELPGASVTTTPEPAAKRSRLHVSLLALVKDAGGQVVEKASRDFLTEIPDERLSALRAGAVTDAHAITLPPGHYTVETAVVDREGGRASTGAFEIDNPARQGRLGLSSLALVQKVEPAGAPGDADAPDPFQAEGQRVTPELAASLPAGVQPSVYFVVYPDKSKPDRPKIEVRFLRDGQAAAQQTAELPAPDASGAIPMTIGAIALPGNYELKIVAIQGGESAEESIHYSIAAQ
jgi:PA14 domain